MTAHGLDPLWRFMGHVDTSGDCWEWLGGISTTGYATFNPAPSVKVYSAKWLLGELGYSTDGRASYLCGNTRCVRPSHVLISTVDERFWSQVIGDGLDECWTWTGHTVKRYGRFNEILAHRFAYERLVAPIPDGLTLDHLCCNPPCVNPWHLDPVPQSVNASRYNAGRTTDLAHASPGVSAGDTTPTTPIRSAPLPAINR
jgi:hypothetical protein